MKPLATSTRSWKTFRFLDLVALACGGFLACAFFSLRNQAFSAPPRRVLVLVPNEQFRVQPPPPFLIVPREGPFLQQQWEARFREQEARFQMTGGGPSFDRCLVPIEVNDPRFVLSAGQSVDPRMVVPPRVVGLPAARSWNGPRR